jgi:hypothetical protein
MRFNERRRLPWTGMEVGHLGSEVLEINREALGWVLCHSTTSLAQPASQVFRLRNFNNKYMHGNRMILLRRYCG